MTLSDISTWHTCQAHPGPFLACPHPTCRVARAQFTPVREQAPDLSSQLDMALTMEDHHREQLVWWKRRRRWLEGQVPVEDVFREFVEEELG